MTQTTSSSKKCTCSKHGEYVNQWIQIAGAYAGCPVCHDEYVEEQELKAAETAGERSLVIKGVPERYRNATMRNYLTRTDAQRVAVRQLVQYVRDMNEGKKTPNLVIWGAKGTGKTHLMWAMTKAISGARYTKASELIRRVKVSFSPAARENEIEILDEMSKTSLLIIDEVGRQGGTVFEGNFIFDLIDNRYNAYLPTIVVSNLPPSGANSMETFLGSAAMDRLNEDAEELVFNWANWREGTA